MSGTVAVASLSAINLIVYVVRGALLGSVSQDLTDGDTDVDTNSISTINSYISLIAIAVGCAASLAGVVHFLFYTHMTKSVTFGFGLVQLLLVLTSMATSSLELHLQDEDDDVGKIENRLETQDGLAILQVFLHLFWHAAIFAYGSEAELTSETDLLQHVKLESRGQPGSVVMAAVSALNFAVYVVILALAGDLVQTNIDDANDGVADGLLSRANRAVPDLAFFTLVSGTVGAASAIVGFAHYLSWTLITRWIAVVMGVVALLANLVAGGYGMRVLELDDDGIGNDEDLDEKFEALASFAIVQILTQSLLVFAALLITENVNYSPWLMQDGMPGTEAKVMFMKTVLFAVAGISLLTYLARAGLALNVLYEVVTDIQDGDLTGILAETNVVAVNLILTTVVSSVIGVSSCLNAVYHVIIWHDMTKNINIAVAALSLCVNVLAVGFAWKHLEVGDDAPGNTELEDVDNRYDILAAFGFINLGTQFVLLVSSFLGDTTKQVQAKGAVPMRKKVAIVEEKASATGL